MNVPADAADVPLCRDQQDRETLYEAARTEGRPYLAVEASGDGYGVVYDLLPAGRRLDEAATERLREAVTDAVERIVADEERPTGEVQHGVGPEMGSLAGFEREESAREVAAAVGVVLDEEIGE